MRRVARGFLLLAAVFCAPLTVTAEEVQSAFLPTWKLLSAQEKQQFISGYLQGWRDAARLLEVTQGYVQERPAEAASSIERLAGIYGGLSGLHADAVAAEVERFYHDPANSRAPLSAAITAARNSLR